MTPQELKEILLVIKESGLEDFKIQLGDVSVEGSFRPTAQTQTNPLKEKLAAMGNPPTNILNKFSNQPEVQYFKDTNSSITEAELVELGYAGVKPIQKKQAKVVKVNDV